MPKIGYLRSYLEAYLSVMEVDGGADQAAGAAGGQGTARRAGAWNAHNDAAAAAFMVAARSVGARTVVMHYGDGFTLKAHLEAAAPDVGSEVEKRVRDLQLATVEERLRAVQQREAAAGARLAKEKERKKQQKAKKQAAKTAAAQEKKAGTEQQQRQQPSGQQRLEQAIAPAVGGGVQPQPSEQQLAKQVAAQVAAPTEGASGVKAVRRVAVSAGGARMQVTVPVGTVAAQMSDAALGAAVAEAQSQSQVVQVVKRLLQPLQPTGMAIDFSADGNPFGDAVT